MNDKIIIKFLPETEHKHLRVIKLNGREYNKFTSFILYLRDFEFENLDNIDNAILDVLNQSYNVEIQLNTKIIFENQLDEIRNRYKLEEYKDFTIQLSPIATDELFKQMQIGREAYSYIKKFRVSFLKGYNFMHFDDYFVAYLQIDELESLHKTIKPI